MKMSNEGTSLHLLLIVIFTTGITLLHPFRPSMDNFKNEYMEQVFKSWIRQGNYPYDAPAKLSHYSIHLSYSRQHDPTTVEVLFDLDNGKIASLRELVSCSVLSEKENTDIEKGYRFLLESFLFRLNTENPLFLEDFMSAYSINLVISGSQQIESINNLYDPKNIGARYYPEAVFFARSDSDYYLYEILFSNQLKLRISLPEEKLVKSLTSSYLLLNYTHQVKQSWTDESNDFKQLVDKQPSGIETIVSSNYYPISDYPPYSTNISIRSPISKTISKDLGITDFFYTYHDHHWGREMLHNKIFDPYEFLSTEFPNHAITIQSGNIKLTTPLYNKVFSADIVLTLNQIVDGIIFDSSADFRIEGDKTVILATGESISLSALSKQEADMVAPFLNQLVTMHRVIGTKMINFLLIPADIPVTVVFRDQVRAVNHFDSYTDIVLMLSHYWSEAVVYFSIDTVKKVNSFIEISGSLIAQYGGSNFYDFVEVRFSLDKNYRIDIAMLVIHSNLSDDEIYPR